MTHNIEVESGKTVKLPTAGKYCDRDIVVAGFGSNEAELQAKYEEGKADGITAGAEICAAKHFTYNFVGDGSTSVSFYTPFEPDALFILGFDPSYGKGRTNALGFFVADLRAFGYIAGVGGYVDASGAMKTAAFTTTAILTRYSRAEDGIITVGNIHPSVSITFAAGGTYTVIAVKYTEQNDKERITDYVNSLTGSGTATFNQAKVNAAFTDDEWAELIATKPNWTFTLI